MQALVEKATAKILCLATEPSPVFSGSWGEGLQSGTLALVPAPEGEFIEDLVYAGTVVIVDPDKKSKKQAVKDAAEVLKALKKSDLSNLDKVSDAVIHLAKVMVANLRE